MPNESTTPIERFLVVRVPDDKSTARFLATLRPALDDATKGATFVGDERPVVLWLSDDRPWRAGKGHVFYLSRGAFAIAADAGIKLEAERTVSRRDVDPDRVMFFGDPDVDSTRAEWLRGEYSDGNGNRPRA